MKIGIVGSGMIAKDCLEAITELGEITCTALCVRTHSIEKGMKLAEQFHIGEVYTDYAEFLQKSDMEFVYIGLVNSVHYEYAKQALEAGHHVIMEKPFTATLAEAQELIQFAKKKQLFLFEAITLLYFPNFEYVKEQLTRLGEIKMVQCNFSQYSSRYDRYLKGEIAPAFDTALSGGALYDLNVYNIYYTVGLFGAPNSTFYSANRGYNGVDTSGILTMEYDDFVAVCAAAKDSSSPNHATIQGSKGYLRTGSQTSLCTNVESMIEGKQTTYNGNVYTHRMQHEFVAFEKMYQEKDLEQCYEKLTLVQEVMKILESNRSYS